LPFDCRAGLAWGFLVVLAAGPALAEGRDWDKHPAIVELETDHDIYALGDVHGDYDRLVQLLAAAKLIADEPGQPEAVRWRAGQGVLVCTGDLIDKGDQSVRVLQLFRALQVEAARAGGRVLVTMGNHEAEFLARPTGNKKAAEFVKDLRAHGVEPKDVAAGTDALGLGAFLRGLPFAVRVNDWFFSHAGNTHGQTLARLKEELEQGVAARGFAAAVLLDDNSLLEARLHPQPWWERDGEPADAGPRRLRDQVRALGVKHLVLGHQADKVTFADGSHRKAGQMFEKYDGLVFLIDVGMSRAVGFSTGALLHIQQGKRETRASAIDATGKSRALWAKK